jgi:hypothetical protein
VATVLENIPFHHRNQYVNLYLVELCYLSNRYFVWRWHTHTFCGLETQKQVITSALALSKIVPSEIMNMILSRATAETKIEVDD